MTYRNLAEVYKHITSKVIPKFKHIVMKVAPLFHHGTLVKIRISLIDNSYLDIYWSLSGKYSYHWERRHINGSIYRHDNAPHQKWRKIKTFPKHFHCGREDNVVESHVSDDPVKAVEEFYIL